MAFKITQQNLIGGVNYGSVNKPAITADGIPYLWNSADNYTLPYSSVKVKAGSPQSGNALFGNSVAVGANRIVIGAPGTNSYYGRIYIYDGNGTLISTVPGDQSGGEFGSSVAIFRGVIYATMPGYFDGTSTPTYGAIYQFDYNGNYISHFSITTTGAIGLDRLAVNCNRIVFGNPLDSSQGSNYGSVSIWKATSPYGFVKKLTASGFDAVNNRFGYSVAVGSNRIVVGSPNNNGILSTGAAWLYDIDGNFIKRITPTPQSSTNRFGSAVAVGCGRIVVSDYALSTVYIYNINGDSLLSFTIANAASYAFGWSVAVGSGRIVIGARLASFNSVAKGGVYIYDLDGNFIGIITDQAGQASDYFGQSVAIGHGRVVAGAYGDDDDGSFTGSACIFKTPLVYNIYDIRDTVI